MCGISGYISKKKLIRENAIKNTLKLMSRRGPDAQKIYYFKFGEKEV
jgi:asparagine synthetase B (glutamine-hydrolysing)